MRLLLDNNLSPQLARTLREAGHDTEHVRDHGLQAAPDARVMRQARDHDQVLVSADTDFGTLLARTGADRPSVILIRRSSARRASELATLLLSNLDAITEDLESGAVVVITDTDLRVRALPIPPGPRSGSDR
jgi:predicted nuclease of predicted toxin-antitoxin system